MGGAAKQEPACTCAAGGSSPTHQRTSPLPSSAPQDIAAAGASPVVLQDCLRWLALRGLTTPRLFQTPVAGDKRKLLALRHLYDTGRRPLRSKSCRDKNPHLVSLPCACCIPAPLADRGCGPRTPPAAARLPPPSDRRPFPELAPLTHQRPPRPPPADRQPPADLARGSSGAAVPVCPGAGAGGEPAERLL
jgi:hypothetical protein